MKKRRRNRCLSAFLFAALLTLALAATVHAAAYRKKWVRNSGNYYYYDKNGTPARGLVKIGKRQYYFDSRGVQRRGWRKIGNYYYYFRNVRAKGGYMLTGRKVDGIKLGKNGRAVLSAKARVKLPVLVKASLLADSLVNDGMNKNKKRQTVFWWIVENCADVHTGDYFHGYPYWDATYANLLFSLHYGDCYVFNAGLAYLFNAIGCSNVQLIHSGAHAWVEWNGLYYDTHWTQQGGATVYGMKPENSGVGKLPALAGTERYWKNIDS